MAIWTKELTWTYSVNNVVIGAALATETNQRIMLAIKNGLLATGQFSVKMSSDGSSTSATDLWTTFDKIVWSAGNHAWMVLTSVAGWDMLISCSNGTSSTLGRLSASQIGYSGGTIGASPTNPGDEIAWSAFGWITSSTSTAARVHVLCSTDGYHARVLVHQAGTCRTAMFFEGLSDAVPGWNWPFIIADCNNIRALDWSGINGNGRWRSKINAGTNFSGSLGTESFPAYTNSASSQLSSGIINDLASPTGYAGVLPVFGSESTSPTARGRHGRLQDMWIGSQAVASGDYFPSGGPSTFAQFGHVVIPWDPANSPLLT